MDAMRMFYDSQSSSPSVSNVRSPQQPHHHQNIAGGKTKQSPTSLISGNKTFPGRRPTRRTSAMYSVITGSVLILQICNKMGGHYYGYLGTRGGLLAPKETLRHLYTAHTLISPSNDEINKSFYEHNFSLLF